ncbi:MAG TPA: hypothetical protein VM425_10385 [Myxococcota bacterium]|nr:hypothetical protein [Myxococcota bacterium]
MRIVAITFLTFFPPLALAGGVTLVTTDSEIRLPRGSGSIRLIYRNESPIALLDARVSVESETPLEIVVRPASIPRCLPADRCVFEIDAKSKATTPHVRFPISATLHARGQPDLHSLRLFADNSPRAGRQGRGWMEAGTINVGKSSRTSRVLGLAALSLIPLLALVFWGLFLKRRSRRE